MVRVSTLKHALAGILASAALVHADSADPTADIGALQQTLSSTGDSNGPACSQFLAQVKAAVDDIENYQAAKDVDEQNYQLALIWFALCVNPSDAKTFDAQAGACTQITGQNQASLQSVVSPLLSVVGLGFSAPCATLQGIYKARVGSDPPLNVPQDPDATETSGNQPVASTPAANPTTTTIPAANTAWSSTTTIPAITTSTATATPGNNGTTTGPPTPPEPTNGAVAGNMPLQNCLLALAGAVFFATTLL